MWGEFGSVGASICKILEALVMVCIRPMAGLGLVVGLGVYTDSKGDRW